MSFQPIARRLAFPAVCAEAYAIETRLCGVCGVAKFCWTNNCPGGGGGGPGGDGGGGGATGSGGEFVSRMRTQPPSPSLLLPGGVKLRVPLLVNGEPTMFVNLPLLGSNQRVIAGPLSFDMSMVNVRRMGV